MLAQTQTDFELIIVGDGCGDDTRAIVASRAETRIRFVDAAKAPGFGYATRRAALETATGELVAFIADDDLMAPHHLAVLEGQLQQHDIAYTRPIWCVPSGELVPMSFDLRDATTRSQFARTNVVPAVFWALRRTALAAAGGWPVHVDVAADWHLWRAVLEGGTSIGYSAEATAVHFRAKRRDGDHEMVAAILAIPDRSTWWPAAATVSAGTQVSLVEASSDNGWWSALTDAAVTIEHHLAFAHTDELAHPIDDPRIEATRVATRDAYERSISWQVTRPLRWLRRILTPR